MTRKSDKLLKKRNFCGRIGCLAKIMNSICFGIILNTATLVIYSTNPRQFEDLFNISMYTIWTCVGLSALFNIIILLNREDRDVIGTRVLNSDCRMYNKSLVISGIIFVINLLAQDFVSVLFYEAVSKISSTSFIFSLIAYKSSKKNVKYFDNSVGINIPAA